MIDRGAKYNELLESSSHGQTIEELCDCLDEVEQLKARVDELEGSLIATHKADAIREAAKAVLNEHDGANSCHEHCGNQIDNLLEEYADKLEEGKL